MSNSPSVKGSSPHTRGALWAGRAVAYGRGIIPAYAGSTDHAECSLHCPVGSSPHTRGAQFRRSRISTSCGIIPAYAGSTQKCGEGHTLRADHPRIRGEHDLYHSQAQHRRGSSPHTRGALLSADLHVVERGIIPAYAGSTLSLRGRRWGGSDHPRIRGEHRCPHATASATRGSSPHTRGALAGKLPGGRLRRIIPAYAGSTPTAC